MALRLPVDSIRLRLLALAALLVGAALVAGYLTVAGILDDFITDRFDAETHAASDALIDYVLAMAFSKDMQYAGSAERSGAHMAKFTTALGARQAVEAVANVNTSNSQPNS